MSSTLSSSSSRAIYSEIERTRSFLDGLGQLPRPQATIEDAQFLTYYSITAQKLTLNDILSHCSLTYTDALEEFPSTVHTAAKQCSSVLFHKVTSPQSSTVESTVPVPPKLHLNHKLLAAKQDQLHSLIHLYESEIQWLSLSSRLWVGAIRGRNVALLIDFTDAVCLNTSIYATYITLLNVLVDEQLSCMDKLYLYPLGTNTCEPVVFDVRNWDNFNTLQDIKSWVASIKAQGSCNLLSALKKVLQLNKRIDTIAVLLCCSRPNQKLPILYDYLMQLMTGLTVRPHFHFTAINTPDDVQKTFKLLAHEMKGHYHQLTFVDGQPLMKDTLIKNINNELLQAHDITKQIENIKKNIFDESLLEALRQLVVVSDWPRDDTFTPPTSPVRGSCTVVPLTSEEWLKKKGIDSSGLDLYQRLAPYAYKQLTEHVSMIDKSATSSVYDVVMPQILWNDGTYKYLYVNVNQLKVYLGQLKEQISLYGERLSWLATGSRVPFGNISEKRVIIVFDASMKTGLHLTQLQTHLKTLLHEQISKLHSFEVISISDICSQWSGRLVDVNKVTLTEAWKWILDTKPGGTCNLLNALHHILESTSYQSSSIDSIGIYVIVSSMPDQTETIINSYLEQKLTGKRLKIHFIFYQPVLTDAWSVVTLHSGRYGNIEGIAHCLKHAVSGLGSYHQFTNGVFVESTDHSILNSELTRAVSHYDTVQSILDDYIHCYCKRNVRVQVSSEDCTALQRSRTVTYPIYPRPTLTSVARLNSTALKLKDLDRDSHLVVKPTKKRSHFLTCHCYYLGRGIKKGLYYELSMSTDVCSNCSKPLIPSYEEIMTTNEWLKKYSLSALHLYNKKLFKETKREGHKHITTDGHVVDLSISHQQLNLRLKLFRTVKTRYVQRLKWLTKEDSSRAIFGCITGKKVVLLVDVSSSMKEYSTDLRTQLVSLINEQFKRKGLSSFNIIAFATKVFPWQQCLVSNTEENRCGTIQWIEQVLTFGGCSNLYEAIRLSLEMKGQSLYLISDGDTDHTISFLSKQIKELQTKYTHLWTLNTIAYHTEKHDSFTLLQELSSLSNGRYWYHPLKVPPNPILHLSTIQETHKGDDIHLLLKEISLTDHAIGQSLYHLGR